MIPHFSHGLLACSGMLIDLFDIRDYLKRDNWQKMIANPITDGANDG